MTLDALDEGLVEEVDVAAHAASDPQEEVSNCDSNSGGGDRGGCCCLLL